MNVDVRYQTLVSRVDEETFASFWQALTSSSRKPAVVVTIRHGDTSPLIPPDEIAERLGVSADVFVVEPGATFKLTNALGGKEASVHSGWVRIYPAGTAWIDRPELAQKFSPYVESRRRLISAISEAVLDLSYRESGIALSQPPAQAERAEVRVVGALSTDQALVQTGDRVFACMDVKLLELGPYPAERLVMPGMTFLGKLLIEQGQRFGEFWPDPPTFDLREHLAQYVGHGLVTLAKVTGVGPEVVRVLVHPQFPLSIEAGPEEDLRRLARPDDIISVELVPEGDGYLIDFADVAGDSAVSVLPGGPPWLCPSETSSPPEESPNLTDVALTGFELERAELLGELRSVRQRLGETEDAVRHLRRQLQQSRKLTIPRLFTSPEEQLRLELYLAYLEMTPEADRQLYPWPDSYSFGPQFIPSLEALTGAGGIKRHRVVAVMVDVLCVRSKDMASRAEKPWILEGRPEVRSSDGASAFRVRLQTGAHAARRLKFWRLPDQSIELAWVGTHDDGI